MAKKEDFYDELDKKAKHSFCSCQTLALSLLLLAVLITTGIFIAFKKITAAVQPDRQVTASHQDAVKFQDKLKELEKAPGASKVLTLTERELTAVLVESINKKPEVPLRDIQAQINPEAIIINGQFTQRINTQLAITVVPEVVNGKPKLELVKIQAGTLAVPAALTKSIDELLRNILGEQLQNLENVNIKSIQLKPGSMTLTGVQSETPSKNKDTDSS